MELVGIAAVIALVVYLAYKATDRSGSVIDRWETQITPLEKDDAASRRPREPVNRPGFVGDHQLK